MTEVEQIERIRRDPFNIEYIKNPSEELQLVAVSLIGSSIERIKNPTENVKIQSVITYPWAIKFIENPSTQVQLTAVSQNIYSKEILDYVTDENIKLIAELLR